VLESLGLKTARFPALEVLPGETAVSLDLLAERLAIVQTLAEGKSPEVLVAPIHALMQAVPAARALSGSLRVIRPGDRVDLPALAGWLAEGGYTRVAAIESPGEFAVRGGICDLCLPGGAAVRLDLMGDEVEGLFEVDVETMGSGRRLEQVEIVAQAPSAAPERADLADYIGAPYTAILAETVEIAEQGRSYLDRAADATSISTAAEAIRSITSRAAATIEINQLAPGAGDCQARLPVEALPAFAAGAAEAVGELAELAEGLRVAVLCQNQGEVQRMTELLHECAPGAHAARIEVVEGYLHRGFVWREPAEDGAAGLALVPYHELLHRYQLRRRLRRAAGRAADRVPDIEPGDYVVHRDQGIAKFLGLGRLAGNPSEEEFLTLEFARGARLHVPASQIDLVQCYLGAFEGTPELSHLGGRKWSRQKQEVSDAVRDVAADLLAVQAARAAQPGIRYPADTPWQREFEAEFPYTETEDQLAAIAQVKRDMCDPRPADRLICGDVGFGKTEVAMRAAFKAVEYGKQVAVLVPTTVLAEQHERTFRDRFAAYPFRIESISRFKTRGQQAELLEALRRGQVDVIVGTHRLLGKDVKFADLGLVVIDEEQRFGVQHKQRLLAFRMTADVITMSATPIPRTMHMAMLNLRDISCLATAPSDRRAIVTEVIAWDRERVVRGIRRELAREGQVFFVHNRVHDIEAVADEVRELVPEARVIVGHGQMPARRLESVMLRFLRHDADVLVCTTIIESGIDIPTANTIFIANADMFGLSELHQLRGRVGRYKHRAWCYLLLPTERTVSQVALRRLQAIEQFAMLGAGFRIALRDLEIRGAGNLLGAEQSGHIAAVGYEMYCRLLEQAVSELRHGAPPEAAQLVVELGFAGSLPKGYVPAAARRMEAYRRISRAATLEELARVEHDLTTAYGDPPASAQTLLRLAELRLLAGALGVRSIVRHDGDVIFTTERPGELERALAGIAGTLRLVQAPIQVYWRPPPGYLEPATALAVLIARLREGARSPAAVY
jgi:transcription-repair coupling factor (superfamily II helicase)